MIGRDFDLPMQITASPAQASPTVRSLEEELQEAIQRVQVSVFGSVCAVCSSCNYWRIDCCPSTMRTMCLTVCLLFLSPCKMDPAQSIDDILEDNIGCTGKENVWPMNIPTCRSLTNRFSPTFQTLFHILIFQITLLPSQISIQQRLSFQAPPLPNSSTYHSPPNVKKMTTSFPLLCAPRFFWSFLLRLATFHPSLQPQLRFLLLQSAPLHHPNQEREGQRFPLLTLPIG